jgi:hypothetical protein
VIAGAMGEHWRLGAIVSKKRAYKPAQSVSEERRSHVMLGVASKSFLILAPWGKNVGEREMHSVCGRWERAEMRKKRLPPLTQ